MARRATPSELSKWEKENKASSQDKYLEYLNRAIAETADYARQSDENLAEVANTISGGGSMTALKPGDVSAFDWDNQRMHEIGRAIANKIYRDMGLFDDPRYATNKGYVSLVGDEYLNSQLADLQNQLANFEQQQNTLYERNKANLPKYEADKQKAAEWRNFFDLAGLDGEPTLENMLTAEGIYNGTTARSARDFDLMDDETFDREYAVLESWYKGLDPSALMADPEAPTLASADNSTILNNISVVQGEIERRAQLNAIRDSIRSDANYNTLSAYNGPTMDEDAWINHHIDQGDIDTFNSLYSFVNNNPSWEQKTNAREKLANVAKYVDAGYDYLTPDELADYNALINAGRTEEAAQYLDLLSSELLYRRAMVMQEYQRAKATNPLLAAPAWVDAGIQTVANVFYLPQQIYETAVGKDNPYSSAYDALNKSQWTTQAQIGAIADADIPDWADAALTFLYKGVSGARDNAARIIAGGGNPTAALILAGAQSASGSLQDSSERSDMSSAAKIIKALGTAAIEVGTEKIGLDALFDKGQKGAIQYMKKVILSEVGEETLNAVSEPVLESVVAYLFDHEADIMSGPEFWKNLTDTAITTAISSFFMGGGGAISNDLGIRSIGKDVVNNGDLEGILRISDSYTGNSDVVNAAKKVRDKQAAGGKVSNRDVGELVTAVSDAIGEKNSKAVTDVLDSSIENRLTELGENEANAAKLAPVIRKLYQGKKLTIAERAGLEWTDNASQVVKEMTTTETVSKNVVPGAVAGTEGRQEDGTWVEGDAAAAERNRVGHNWKNEAEGKVIEAQREGLLAGARFTEALTTKSSTATAVGKARDKAKNAMNGKPKMETREVMVETSDGETKGTFDHVEKKNGELTLVMKDAAGDKVEAGIDAIKNGGDEGVLTILNYAQEGSRHDMSAEEVNTMVNTYLHEGGNVDSFVQQYERSYLSGYSGINAPAGTLSEGVASIAYEHGKAEAVKDEADRVARAQKARKVETPTVGWLGDVTSDTSIKGLGDAGALPEAVKNMTDTQQAMVEFGRHLAKSAKINVVFFASKAGTDGKYTTQNGSYDPNTHTIYLDINSGASTEKGRQALQKSGTLGAAIGRVAGHELTHVLEATSPEYYAQYKQAVKAALKAKGVDYASLVREKINNAVANGEKLTYYGAEAEVIADASEYMLQDSKFVKNMDQGLKGKVKEVVQKFLNKVNEAFRMLTGGHIESAVLRTMTDGVAHYEKQLQDLWDMAFDEMLGAEVRRNTMTEAEELSDVNTQFSIREEAPPKKTGIAYKVFFEKDGKLYPPMVANPGGADTPVGVWLNADVGASAPPSKTGRPQVQAGGKGTNASKMSLAFRPGWHLGDIPKATQFDRLNRATGVKELFPYNFVWAECEYAMDVDYQEEAMSYGYNANGKFQHSLAGLPRLPVDGYYHYRTNPNPNTVPWVITGAMKVNRVLSRQEVDDILRENGVEPTKWQGPNGEQMEVPGGDEKVQKSVRERDSEYLTAVERGDMAKAQQMVDAAAKRAGYTIVGYHGTKAPTLRYDAAGLGEETDYHNKRLPFTVFKPNPMSGVYVASNRSVAEGFNRGFGGSTGTTYSLYVKMDNPFVVNEHVWTSVPYYYEVPTPTEMRKAGYKTQDVGTEEIAQYARSAGYDGVIIEGIREGAGDQTDDYIAFSPEQLKLADPVTYDDSGNVVLLSERFNAANEDIRYSIRGSTVTEDDVKSALKWCSYLNAKGDDSHDWNYVPVRTNTPAYLLEHFNSADIPMVMNVGKIRQAMSPDGKKFGESKGHGFSAQEMTGIMSKTSSPEFFSYSNKRGNCGIVVEHNGKGIVVIVAPPRHMNADLLLSEHGGIRTLTVTMFARGNVDDAIAYLEDDGYTEKPLPAEASGDLAPLRTEGVATDKVPHPSDSVKQEIQKPTRDDGSAYQSEAMAVADGMQDTDGKRMFSLRSFNEDYDTYRVMLLNHNVPLAEVNDLFDTVDEVMKAIEKDREILDFGWNVGREDRSFNPVKPNSDPLYEVSLDFSTLCRKRLLQQTVQERLEAMYDTVLTKTERVAIRNELMKLREEGKQIEVACALCYVESTRLKSPAQIQRFFDDRRAVMVDYFAKKNKAYMKEVNARSDELIVKFGHEPGTKKKELNSFQKKSVENLKQSMYKKYKPSAEEEAIIATALELPGESFKTDRGLWNLKKEHEEIFDAYTSFVRNATKSKGIEGDEAWWAGDSKSISDKLIEKMNKENGLRTQSWSDFQVIHLLDYISAIIELSTRGAKMQSYTKVPDFVKLMGDTGVMINLSLIPKGFDGTLNYDPIEGMPIEEALALREMFPNTAGTICIGITKKHIEMLLANPDIDYVIPYHSSSLDKKTRQQMGMKVWEDFQSYQNEKNKDYPNTDSKSDKYHKKPLFSEWFDYNTVSERAKVVGAEQAMKEAADRYIDLCHRRGLQEKFEQFSGEPNYWKLLIDRKMINQQTGEIIKQEAVQPRFNKGRILDILSAEVNRFKAQNADKDAAVEHIVNAWESGDIRKAAKSKKVRDQVSAFNDTVTVANIVASAAELDAQEQTQKSIRDLPEDTVTYRDYLTDADSSIAATIEERNALSIYQKLLKNHAEASEKVIEAETALAAADEAHKPEARKTLAAARVKQKDLYNRLLNVERQAHVQTLVKRSNQIIGDLYGKNQADLDKMLSAKEKQIASLKADITGLKGAARTQREADIREAEREVAALKSKATQALLANSEKYQRQIADIRLRRDLNIEIGKRTRHIKRIVKRLNDRIIHEEDYKNVKEPLKPAVHKLVQTFIDGFGNMVFDSKTTDKLKSVYDMLKQEDETSEYFDEEVSDWLTTLAELARQDEARRTSGSTLESLNDKLYIYTTLSDIVDHVAHMVTAADTMFIEGKKAEVSAVTEEVGDTLAAKKDRRELAGWAGKLARFADNLIVKGNMMPQFFFEGLNNKGMMRLYDDLQNGVRKYSERMLVGDEFLSDAMRRHGYHTWGGMKKPVSFKTKQGHTIYLTRENMMWIYATAKREASNPMMDTHHLDEGGITYEETPTEKGRQIEGKGVHHLIAAEDVSEITKMLTAEQIAYVDECVEFLSTECAEWGNEASLKLFGIKKYKEGYYFPFKVDSNQLYKNSAAGATSTVSDARVKHTSFTHSIKKGANTPLVMGNFTSVITDHINQMATYSGMVVPIENMSRVLNRKVYDGHETVNIRSLIARKYGDNTARYIDDLLKDLNGGPQTDNRGSLDAGLRLFKRNAVVGKLSVALQQPTAVARAFAYISPRWFANLHLERPKHTWERMMKYSSTTFLKDMGGFNVGMGKGASNWLERGDLGNYRVYKRAKFLLDQKSLKDAVGEWNDFLTGLPGFMDKITWCAIWNATENEQAHQHPSMDRNSDEFLELVGRRFDDIVNHTQVYDSILSKSQNMRSKNAIAKMATSFMAESTLNMNLAYRAIASKDGKQVAKVTSSLILNAALGAAAYALIGAFNKDDDDRTLEEKYATAFAGRLADNLNPLASIPYLSDLWNKLQGYDVERTDMAFLLDLIEDGGKFWNKMTSPDEKLSYRDYENFVGGIISTVTGIPAKNWMGDARRIWNMTHTSTEDAPLSSVWYGILDEVVPGRESTNTAYYERYLAALQDVDKQEQYDLKDYLMSTKGVKEATVRNGVVNAYKKEYLRGGIAKNEAVDFLVKNDLVKGETADKKRQAAFKKVDEWDEGSEDYSVYNTIFDAVKKGNTSEITKGIKEMTANGYVESDVVSGVRGLIRESYMEGTMTQSQVKAAYKSHFAPKNFDVNDQNEWYWLFRELDWGKKNHNSTDGYSNYIFLKDNFSKYNETAIRNAWNELTTHGYEDKDVKTYVRTYILKPMVQEGKISTARATELLKRWAPYNKDSDNVNKPKEWAE